MENSQNNPTLIYLDQVLAFESSKLVGKCMKRFEIIAPEDDSNLVLQSLIKLLKKEMKELIYESFRDLLDIMKAYDKGLENSYFKFTSKKEGE